MQNGWLGIAVALALGAGAPAEAPFRPTADRNGILELPAARALLRGERLTLVADPGYIGDWSDAREDVAWEFLLPRGGTYIVLVEYAAPRGRGGSLFEVEVAGQVRQGYVHATGDATTFLPQPLREAVALEAGRHLLRVRARDVPRGLVMNLRRVRLVPDGD
jgi:hypothetical protein